MEKQHEDSMTVRADEGRRERQSPGEFSLLDHVRNGTIQLPTAKREQKAFLRFLREASSDPELVEQVHRLRDAVLVSALRGGERKTGLTLGVTTPRGGEGGSFVALLLALSLGECATRRVTLLDGKFSMNRFQLLSDLLGLSKNSVNIEQSFSEIAGYYNEKHPNFYFLRNMSRERSISFFSHKRLGFFLCELRSLFDFTVIDLPPMLKDTTSVFVLPQVDRLYLTVEASKTRLAEVARCIEVAKNAGCGLSGVVINKQRAPWWSRFSFREFFY